MANENYINPLYTTTNDILTAVSNIGSNRFINRATYDNASGTALTPGLLWMAYSETLLTVGSYNKTLEVPTKLPEKTDLKVSCQVVDGTAGGIGYCALRGWLETN